MESLQHATSLVTAIRVEARRLGFDMTVDLDGVPDGYAAMDNGTALKVMVKI